MTAKKRKKKGESEQSVDSEVLLSDSGDICPECKGYGFIITEEGEAVPCGCRSGVLASERLSQTNIPPKFSQKTLANFTASTHDKQRKELLEKAAEFVENFQSRQNQHQGILMIGKTGSGKTHLSVAILREIIVRGFTGLYFNVPEFLHSLRSSYQADTELLESDIIERTTRVDLLVLDDLGAERTSGWVRDRLYLIINRRYEQIKPIIVTTNLGFQALRDQVGERIVSRLYEMCPQQISFPEQDYRIRFLEAQEKRFQKRKK